MKILIAITTKIPVSAYGGTERVIWYLGKELAKLGHEVTYLVNKGSSCDFAKVLHINEDIELSKQIPKDIDIVHFHYVPPDLSEVQQPYVVTIHGNVGPSFIFDNNTIFISKNQASRYSSNCFVHNGLDWEDYSAPLVSTNRNYFHFLGNAAWRVKNVKGAINVIKQTQSEKIKILGGHRLNFKMGFRFTLTLRAQFYGMVGGKEKFDLLRSSKGLIFPVRWHEPFGLSIIESLYFGCPVFGTPYGSLPELVPAEVGYLSNKEHELVNAIENVSTYSSKICHEYARENFNSKKMALAYLEKYFMVLDGEKLNQQKPFSSPTPDPKFLDWSC
ncbi:glycosyltransferase family 4 protein [Pseudoxanthomonas sp. SGD-10]|nr:glycosyltransferase family 4 protein [Pseudoxanthomonas sp. SGD-10]